PDSKFYQVQIHIVWKNVDYVYHLRIAAMVAFDLSGSNSLSQEIPNGLTTLLGLRYLNLSGNHLSGCIPEDIGNLVRLLGPLTEPALKQWFVREDTYSQSAADTCRPIDIQQ
uniref:Malectin-like domain-containing protein n=2 Tax=Aegilops tauschii TaxID=37682 RepID=A0A453G8S2_AEGTS